MLEVFLTPEGLISLMSLTALEIVLGLDNIVFISILAGNLPKSQQLKARKMGLAFALIARILLLFTISWFMALNQPLTTLFGIELSGRNIILLIGGIFLIGKSAHEIYDKTEADHTEDHSARKPSSMTSMMIQIALLDVVFSIDSVITAVGMADHISIMVTAMVIAVGIMIVFAGPVGDFVNDHPSMKILALAFLLLVGVLLVAEGIGQHVNKGTIYFAMAFALGVELVNMRIRRVSKPKPAS